MKASYLILLPIVCVALIYGTGHAAPPRPVSQQPSQSAPNTVSNGQGDGGQAAAADSGDKAEREGKPSDEHGDRQRVSDKNPRRGHASQIGANRLTRPSNDRGRSTNFRRPALGRSGDPVKEGSVQSGTVEHVLRVRPPNGLRRPVPSLDNARHRGLNPAAINGSASSDRRNTATIDGTRMSRKP